MLNKIILASKSKVRKSILDSNQINNEVKPSNVDEDVIKKSLLKDQALPEIISKNLAELKANKVSQNDDTNLVLGADSVIDLNGKIISKPINRDEALKILKELNGKKHHLITSTVVAQNKNIIWRHLDKSTLVMRSLTTQEIDNYLNEVDKSILNLVGVYAIEQEGIKLFEQIDGDFFSIQGLSVTPLINFLRQHSLILNNE